MSKSNPTRRRQPELTAGIEAWRAYVDNSQARLKDVGESVVLQAEMSRGMANSVGISPVARQTLLQQAGELENLAVRIDGVLNVG